MVRLLLWALLTTVLATVEGGPTVCHTEECLETADYLMRAMDTSADPCIDFRQFVCGIKINRTLEADQLDARAEAFVREFTRLLENQHREPWLEAAANYHTACLGFSIPPAALRAHLSGVWKSWGDASTPLEELLGRAAADHSVFAGFHVLRLGMETDIVEVKPAPAYIHSSELYYRRADEGYEEQDVIYVFQASQRFEKYRQSLPDEFTTDFSYFFSLESALYMLGEPFVISMEPRMPFNYTLEEFGDKFSHVRFNMSRYLRVLFPESDFEKTMIQIDNSHFLIHVIRELPEYPIEVIKDYLLYRYVEQLQDYVSIHADTNNSTPAREKRCMQATWNEFWPLKLRTDQRIVDGIIPKLWYDVEATLLQVLRDKVTTSMMLPDEERAVIMRKLDNLKVHDIYPREFLQPHHAMIDKIYHRHVAANFTSDNPMGNIGKLMTVKAKAQFDLVYKLNAPSAHGYYGRILMQIEAAWPYSALAMPLHLNSTLVPWARLAFTFAHELAHLVDPLSWHYDVGKVLRPVHEWTKSFAERLEGIVDCHREAYIELRGDANESSLDMARLARDEVFADLFGMELALEGFRRHVNQTIPIPYSSESIDALMYTALGTTMYFCEGEEKTLAVEGFVPRPNLQNNLNEEHPAGVIRLKLLQRLSSFRSAFKCSPKSAAKTCAILF